MQLPLHPSAPSDGVTPDGSPRSARTPELECTIPGERGPGGARPATRRAEGSRFGLRWGRFQALAAVFLAVASCGGEDEAEPQKRRGPLPSELQKEVESAVEAPLAAQLPRSRDLDVLATIHALEMGDLTGASKALLRIPESEGYERALCRARLLSLQGQGTEAVREIEAIKEVYPDQARVYATAAEIYLHLTTAEVDMRLAAEDEIKTCQQKAGITADYSRARGAYMLAVPGGAEAALVHLLRAREMDDEVPFLRAYLVEAHRVLGTVALRNNDPKQALRHARDGLREDPDNATLERLLADALAMGHVYQEAIEIYERQAQSGYAVVDELARLCQKAGVGALLEKDRERAIERFLRARELGLSDTELGFGAKVLEDEADGAIEAGYDAYDAGLWDQAKDRFERALVFDANSIRAHNGLASCAFRQEQWNVAIDEWFWVHETLEDRGVPMPEPVHVNIAKAMYQAGRVDEIAPLLESYLDEHPDGDWAAQTQEALDRLGGG